MSILGLIMGLPLILPAKNYKGAELRTKEAYLYGRFEVRYKASAGSGHVATFFTYHEIQSTSEWNEIDIEIHGRYTDDVQMTTITPNQVIHLRHQYVGFNPHIDFHVYAFEWTPGYVAWFIDGEEVYRQTEDHIAALDKPQKIMMNIWNPAAENWAGSWDERILPRFAYYDYVSYAAYTPGTGNVGSGHNFTLQWKDDFVAWNQNRWEKASHTFPGNNCDFTPENVVFKNGYMILCLTDNFNLGYTDKTPPTVLWARAGDDNVVVRFSEEVTQTSAEKIENYRIPGGIVTSAKLQPDSRTVVLTVSGLDTTRTFSLICLGVTDKSPGTNAILGQSVPILAARSLSFPVKINVGGDAVEDFLPDQPWGPDKEYGFEDGVPAYQSFPIENTIQDAIYQSERHGLAAYRVRLPNRPYRITLMMAENYFTRPGKRYFDIFVEDKKVANQIDLFGSAGIHAAHPLKLDSVQVNDGRLDIHFCAGLDHPLLNGLIIKDVETGVGTTGENLPEMTYLIRNYPNPFNHSTVIEYFLPGNARVNLAIFDLLGNKIQELVKGYRSSGTYRIPWTAQCASGVYFCRLQVRENGQEFFHVQKMLVLK